MKTILYFVSILSIAISLKAEGVDAAVHPVKQKIVTVVHADQTSARYRYGLQKLAGALKASHYEVRYQSPGASVEKNGSVIFAGLNNDPQIFKRLPLPNTHKEGFVLSSLSKKQLIIAGADDSGVLYGCLELAKRIQQTGVIPVNLQLRDQPEMVLRGTAIGLQKPDYLPGRDVYEYPYTESNFPWFYDRSLWVRYLDMMVSNRFNSLYLWNGHPFSSLVRLKDYPGAVEVNEATFKKNEEIYRFITREADKRGIWVIQMFYNIIIPQPLASAHQMKTQDRNRPIIPWIADYTRKSIAAFVAKYPNVGLMVTLGEAMEGTGQDDVDWFTQTIIPGVKDGLRQIGVKTEPPIILRAHDTDAPRVMQAALPLYKNLYTEAKFNGEALTTYTPRGSWAALHRKLNEIGTVNIENVHILANLEPFRYGSPDFIRKSVQAMHQVYHSNGLHLYPQASFWDWPYTADRTEKRLLEMERDWIWYRAWGRYAWQAGRALSDEDTYWSEVLAAKYGLNPQHGRELLTAYEESGEISPKLLRRYGITDGNRQTLSLGMLMTQLINPYRYGLFTLLYESEAPEGEMIIDYAGKEWRGEKHTGETPVQVAEEVQAHGAKAVAAIEKAAPFVKTNKTEFERLRNDIYCYREMADFYAEKVRAALHILRYKYSGDIQELDLAVPLLKSSLFHYTQLVAHTRDRYLYANSMQTKQRKIPMRGINRTFKEWKEMLPVFQQELRNFSRHIDSLKLHPAGMQEEAAPFRNAQVKLIGQDVPRYTLSKGNQVFTDTSALITALAPELKGLKGLLMDISAQRKKGTEIRFETGESVKVLVGFFDQKSTAYLAKPELETDASANDYGQAEANLSNAILVNGFPVADVHMYSFAPGTHTLTLAKGACLLLGFIPGNERVRIYNAGVDGKSKDIDWLFE